MENTVEEDIIKNDPIIARFWREYPSIQAGKAVSKKFERAHKSGDAITWVVLEKIHGANFSFISDGKNLVCCRRNAVLSPYETFYEWQEARDNNRSKILELFQEVKKIFSDQNKNAETAAKNERLGIKTADDIKYIAVYGELYGGVYPHPDVKDLGKQPIQKGVYYSPRIEFCAFDILIFPRNDAKEPFWMNYADAMKALGQCEIQYSTPLYEGALEYCLDFETKINSTIPKLLGYPPLQKNQIEGVVIKPKYDSLNIPGRKDRAIVKIKNPKFAEVNPKIEETLYEKLKNSGKRAVETIYENIPNYINENRINSLQSKIGPITGENMNESCALLTEDVLKDFCADFQPLWVTIGTEKKEEIVKNTGSVVRTYVTEWRSKNTK